MEQLSSSVQSRPVPFRPVLFCTKHTLKDDWPEFVAYKNSAIAMVRSTQNKLTAEKKKYFHRLGSGGYKTVVPKWEAYENELCQKGITPQTDDWPERSNLWLFAHGVGLDPDIGLIVAKGKWKKRITRVVKKLVDAIEKVKKGEFVPDREDDELTLALGNPEHDGRCRGRRHIPPWPSAGICAAPAPWRTVAPR